MKKRSKFFLAFLLLIIVLVIAIIVFCALFDIRLAVLDSKQKISAIHDLSWNSSYNLKQNGNTCGAHAVMAVIESEKSILIDPYEIYDSIPEKLGRGYVFPWGLTRYLDKQEIYMKSYYLGILPETHRIQWIENRISMNNPVVIIVGTKKYLHYLTILGYSENDFHIYDSDVVGDKNFSSPGNISIPHKEAINRMESACFYGVSLNIAISY